MNQVVPPTPDGSAPSTTIACNGSACQGTYNADVSVTLSANDTGGSGVDKTYYTTDGSTPTTSSTVYSGAFLVPQTSTVKYFSTDHAGNTESRSRRRSRLTRPPRARRSPATARRAGHVQRRVSVTLVATDTGGSGVDKTYYTTDGSTPTTSSTVYSGAFTVSSDTTVRFFSTDLAGNTEAVNAQDQGRRGRADHDDHLQRLGVPGHVHRRRLGHAVRDRHGRLGRGQDLLHDRRVRPDDLEHRLHRRLHGHETTTVKFFSTDLAGNTETPQSQTSPTVPDTAPPARDRV